MDTAGESRAGRRRVLATVGSGLAGLALAGCLGGGGADYESGQIPAVNGSNRSAAQQTAAVASAGTTVTDGVSPLQSLALESHAFVFEGGYKGSTIQGTVANTSETRIELVEVRVRVYDADGAQLGRYTTRTGDLQGGRSWSFTVIILESPSVLDRYEIAVLGTPG